MQRAWGSGVLAAIGRRVRLSAALLLCPALLCGCHTWQKTQASALTAWSAGNVSAAAERLQKARDARGAERELLKLDLAMVDLARGEATAAESRFRELGEELSYLSQRDLAEQTAAAFTDARAKSYSGRDYERQMVLSLGLLSSVMSGSGDAFAWSLQAEELAALRWQELSGGPQAGVATLDQESSPESAGGVEQAGWKSEGAEVAKPSPKVLPAAHDSPLAMTSWLTALVQSETPSRAIETEAALQQVAFWRGEQTTRLPGAKLGVRCGRGNGSLNLVVLAGRAPEWESESAEPTTTALLIADRILSATGRHTLPPTLVSVKIARPRVVWRAGSAAPVVCRLRSGGDGANPRVLDLTTLVDLNAAAEASYRAHRDDELAAAVVRRVVKKGTVYAVKETAQVSGNTLVDLGVNAAGVVWEALERPDTRSWTTLPAVVLAAQEELPAGEHRLELLGSLPNFGARPSHGEFVVRVEDGRNTTVVCVIPENTLAGCISVAGPELKTIPPPGD